jgi:hypothetical protein
MQKYHSKYLSVNVNFVKVTLTKLTWLGIYNIVIYGYMRKILRFHNDVGCANHRH